MSFERLTIGADDDARALEDCLQRIESGARRQHVGAAVQRSHAVGHFEHRIIGTAAAVWRDRHEPEPFFVPVGREAGARLAERKLTFFNRRVVRRPGVAAVLRFLPPFVLELEDVPTRQDAAANGRERRLWTVDVRCDLLNEPGRPVSGRAVKFVCRRRTCTHPIRIRRRRRLSVTSPNRSGRAPFRQHDRLGHGIGQLRSAAQCRSCSGRQLSSA